MSERNILVICPRMGMGDLISFVAHFKTIFYQTKKKLIIITKKTTAGKDILEDEDFCEKIIYLPERKRGIVNTISNIVDFFTLINLIKNFKCERIFILHSSKRYVLASIIARVKVIYAPGTKLQRIFLKNKNIFYKKFTYTKLHPRTESEELIKKIFSLEKISDNYLEKKKLHNNKKFILICIACSGDEKQWGYDNYFQLVKYLINLNFTDFCILAGKKQSYLEKKLITDITKEGNVNLISTSDLDLKKIIKICCESKFFVGNDTGFSHLAVSLKIPSLIIHGDLPPHDYSLYFNPITHQDNVFTKTSIKDISFERTKNYLNTFLKKYELSQKY